MLNLTKEELEKALEKPTRRLHYKLGNKYIFQLNVGDADVDDVRDVLALFAELLKHNIGLGADNFIIVPKRAFPDGELRVIEFKE